MREMNGVKLTDMPASRTEKAEPIASVGNVNAATSSATGPKADATNNSDIGLNGINSNNSRGNEQNKPLHQNMESSAEAELENKVPNSEESSTARDREREPQERIHFSIGSSSGSKKRKKSPVGGGGGDGKGKRAAHSPASRTNVLEGDGDGDGDGDGRDEVIESSTSTMTKSGTGSAFFSMSEEDEEPNDDEKTVSTTTTATTTSEEKTDGSSAPDNLHLAEDANSNHTSTPAQTEDEVESESEKQGDQVQREDVHEKPQSAAEDPDADTEQPEEASSRSADSEPQSDFHSSTSTYSASTPASNTNSRKGTNHNAASTQPEGWRVKLYRLNADGSWDDCGTGRIVCLVSNGKQKKNKNGISTNTTHTDGEKATEKGNISSNSDADAMETEESSDDADGDENSPGGGGEGGKKWANLEEEIYQTLGEPTLCMHAEVPANSQLQNLHLTALTNKPPKLLLRTRVLLRESYQRQGDNIITWCEPFFLPAPGEGQNQGENDPASSSSQSSQQRGVNNGDGDDMSCGVDLALSFQDNAGCREIWNKISKIQHKAYELFEARGGMLIDGGDEGLQEMTRQLMNHHQGSSSMDMSSSSVDHDKNNHKDISGNGNPLMYSENNRGGGNGSNAVGSPLHPSAARQQQQHAHSNNDHHHRDLWGESTGGVNHSNTGIDGIGVDEHDFMDTNAAAVSMAAQAAHYVGGGQMGKNQGDAMDLTHHAQLCNPPTLDNLEKIADVIAASQLQQREAIAYTISQQECAYLRALLALFPAAEAKNNYHALATLASIVKSIFLFNEPNIIQLVASDEQVFEECCSCLEYDPDLKEKANHRWFIQERLRFRTVLIMEDDELIDSIHKAFRVTYIRDTLLRPTMDESSLSTLGSLLTFTHAEVVKGVMCAPRNKNAASHESYLVRILRLLGEEIRAVREIEWQTIEQKGRPSKSHSKQSAGGALLNSGNNDVHSTPWEQHLAPQDDSLSSRKVRRRGCLSFLREMFNMVRMSLQQSDKDDFYEMIVLLDVPVKVKGDNSKDDSFETDNNDTVNLLSLLGAILSDSNADVNERGACLDILSAIAMHEPSLIRKHCLIEFSSSKISVDGEKQRPGMNTVARPEPDDKREVIFACPPTDLCLSLLYVMATENDAGIMLQTCEVLRIVLDTEMLNDPPQLDLGGVIDNEEDEMIGSDNVAFLVGSNAHNGHAEGSEQNSFLQMFYDHYIPWLVAPFQYLISVPKTAIPFLLQPEQEAENVTLLQFLKKRHHRLKDSKISRSGLFKTIPTSPIRLSFSVELLSFCVRAHCFRMKRYLINSRVLINVMKLLSPTSKGLVPSGDRCLKLGALRCLRSIISLKDEFYNRHIIQHSLFTPVFEAFRANPVGDNLVSSSIIEICEFIRNDNIKSLIEDIVTKHMRQQSRQSSDTKLGPSLEDVATPYVDTLTLLRQKYEENTNSATGEIANGTDGKGKRVAMSEKAIEDQRKFRETDEEESYFFDDVEDNNEVMNFNNGQNAMRQGYRL